VNIDWFGAFELVYIGQVVGFWYTKREREREREREKEKKK